MCHDVRSKSAVPFAVDVGELLIGYDTVHSATHSASTIPPVAVAQHRISTPRVPLSSSEIEVFVVLVGRQTDSKRLILLPFLFLAVITRRQHNYKKVCYTEKLVFVWDLFGKFELML